MRRLAVTALVVAAVGFLAYATLVPHAQRPCIQPNLTKACKKYVQASRK